MHFALETNDGGVYRRFGVTDLGGVLQVQYSLSGWGPWVYPKDLLAIQPDV